MCVLMDAFCACVCVGYVGVMSRTIEPPVCECAPVGRCVRTGVCVCVCEFMHVARAFLWVSWVRVWASQ